MTIRWAMHDVDNQLPWIILSQYYESTTFSLKWLIQTKIILLYYVAGGNSLVAVETKITLPFLKQKRLPLRAWWCYGRDRSARQEEEGDKMEHSRELSVRPLCSRHVAPDRPARPWIHRDPLRLQACIAVKMTTFSPSRSRQLRTSQAKKSTGRGELRWKIEYWYVLEYSTTLSAVAAHGTQAGAILGVKSTR
jgi:hypothetical protein